MGSTPQPDGEIVDRRIRINGPEILRQGSLEHPGSLHTFIVLIVALSSEHQPEHSRPLDGETDVAHREVRQILGHRRRFPTRKQFLTKGAEPLRSDGGLQFRPVREVPVGRSLRHTCPASDRSQREVLPCSSISTAASINACRRLPWW